MSEKRFGYGETVLFEWVEEDGEIISIKECVQKLNEQQSTIEAKNEYQRTLEAKIRRLKNRVKILEKAEGWQN